MNIEKEYVRPENLKYLKIVVGFLGFAILVMFVMLIFVKPQTKTNTCTSELEKFDNYVKDNELPITNPDSLCYGINMSTDFQSLESRYAVAKFVGMDLDYQYSLQLEGLDQKATMQIPLTDREATELIVDGYYKVDVNNFCKSILMVADSRMPSPISEIFVKPEKINCE